MADILERLGEIDGYRNRAVEYLSRLIEIRALSPENGGEGEWDKAEYIQSLLDFADSVERYDAEDERAKNGLRPNIVARINGRSRRTLWVVSHMDVVPEGDLSLWESDPFTPRIEEDRVYGRGAEDNGQAIVSTILAGMFLAEHKPELTFGMVFVSDEETGSRYGIRHLLQQGIFKEGDLFLVPDTGSPDGSLIEVAEKNILWLKLEIHGKQGHASRPDMFFNASRRAMKIVLELDRMLHERFNARNNLFEPPYSTFEPTKREKNVDNPNTIPGLDVSYLDCRVLPQYSNEEVIGLVRDFLRRKEEEDGYPCGLEVVQNESSPPTPENSEIVVRLKKALKVARNIDAKLIGIGGNTCASFFRKAGFETAVWSTLDGKAHEPNEYAKVSNIIEDAKVFALLAHDL
ncbi:MAG: M20 family metallo-hydrolase [Archaeoglobi archaeon]|nr:M20 family metallo-hydrolase [Archaeoglobi archaeon]